MPSFAVVPVLLTRSSTERELLSLAEFVRSEEVRSLRIHQAIARQLGTAILCGEYTPGDALNGEIEQALALGVSRTPYREAIRMLVAKGLLEVARRRERTLLQRTVGTSWILTCWRGCSWVRPMSSSSVICSS